MRIVLDLQGAQAASRHRGIGRYTLALAQAIAAQRGEHDIIIALNDAFPDSIAPIREAFAGLLPAENICVWQSFRDIGSIRTERQWHRRSAQMLREAFLNTLNPDVIWLGSMFEGQVDDAVTSIGLLPTRAAVAVTLYDLIPQIHADTYLSQPIWANWYPAVLEQLKHADMLLGISHSACKEATDMLGFPQERIATVGTAADAPFVEATRPTPAQRKAVQARYQITKPFVMYTGGVDPRKNMDALVRAYAALPAKLRKKHQLAIVCMLSGPARERLLAIAEEHGLSPDELVLTGYVPEADLITLYGTCAAFVFPSLHEGFGLPVLEAMLCGAPVIAANNSSLPEVLGIDEALFDAEDDSAITRKLEMLLTDTAFRERLLAHHAQQATHFSWVDCADRAIAAFEKAHAAKKAVTHSPAKTRKKLAYVSSAAQAEHAASFLNALANHYDITLICTDTANAVGQSKHSVKNAAWLRRHYPHYERVLYHGETTQAVGTFGSLLPYLPGVLLLDAPQSDIPALAEACYPHVLASHGYGALLQVSQDISALQDYPSLSLLLASAMGVMTADSTVYEHAKTTHISDGMSNWVILPPLASNADACYRAIEDFYAHGTLSPAQLAKAMAAYAGAPEQASAWSGVAARTVCNYHLARRMSQTPSLLVDVTDIMQEADGLTDKRLRDAYTRLMPKQSVAFVYRHGSGQYYYAHRYGLRLWGLEENLIAESPALRINASMPFSVQDFLKAHASETAKKAA